jgi:tRNA G18 (ribose-2'-O)-methylase SpoU
MKKIESSSNPYFKTLKKLLKTQGIKKEKLFLVMGSKIVREVFKENEAQIKSILIFDEAQEKKFGFSKKLLLLPKVLFQELDVFDTQSAILVMELPQISPWKGDAPNGLELFLPVQDPSNLGAIARSAVAFGVSKIILLAESANPFHPKAVRASSGMSLKMKFEVGPSIHDLHKSLTECFALDMDGASLNAFAWPKDLSLVVGEEGQGLPPQLQKNVLSIPIQKGCESLNVMAATSIALYSYHINRS